MNNGKNKVLIVDDTYEKTQVISSILKNISNCDIDVCMTSRDAIKRMSKICFDLLIVDMQIPLELGMPIDVNGGLELVKHCSNSDSIHKPTHIVGITSHSESFDSCRDYFEGCGWNLLLGSDDHELIRGIVNTKLKHSYQRPRFFDIAIVTALYKIELEAVLKLPCNWRKLEYEGDSNKYFSGEIVLANGDIKSIVATNCSHMGMVSAASTSMKVCSKFQPKLLLMTGIAAGIPGKVELGDVMVADPCWDWGCGKRTIVEGEVSLLNAPHQIALDSNYRSIFQTISADRKYLDEIYCNWKEKERPGNSLNLHIGPIATGAVVLEDPATVRAIVSQHRETIGVEMEAYGVAYAANIADQCSPNTLIIKSVCDFADTNKNDSWQKYAAYTSAQLTYKVLVDFYQEA